MAQMLSIESQGGIVHVRVFANDTFNPISVGHIPILASKLVRDIKEKLEHRPVPVDSWTALNQWRELHVSGTAGAFSLPLWKVIEIAWEVVNHESPGKNPSNFYIESAFPISGSLGRFREVRAIGCPLLKPKNGAS